MKLRIKFGEADLKVDTLAQLSSKYYYTINSKAEEDQYTIDTKLRLVVGVSAFDVAYADRIVHINTADDAKKLYEIIEGKVVARFNDNKVQYSYIDFRPFIKAFDAMPATFNHVEKYLDRPEMLYEKMLDVTSTLCIEDNMKEEQRQALINRLCILGYKALLVYAGITELKPSIQVEAFEPMARVLMFGAEKYERNNWRKKPNDKCETVDSLDRHIKSLVKGQELDPDSGLPHIGHVLCNIMFIEHHFLNYNYEW